MLKTGLTGAAMATLALLAGCSSLPSITGSNSFEGLLGGSGKPAAPAVAGQVQAAVGASRVAPDTRIDCPIVQVAEGQAAFRAFVGADHSSAGVKYQYSFGDMSRECAPAPPGQFTIRLGIEGYVLAGPAGGSGNFNVPVKVTIRRDTDQAVVSTKTYRVATAIASGEAQSTFSIVTEPVAIPFISSEADEDYSVYVGFDGSPDVPKAKVNPRRKRRG